MKPTILLFSLFLPLVACNRSQGTATIGFDAPILAAAKGSAESAYRPCEQSQPPPALHAAVLRHDLKTIENLVGSNVPVDGRDSCGETPLMWTFSLAVAEPSLSMAPSAAEIAKENQRLEQKNAKGMTVALWLLDHGANPHAIDVRGNNVLMYAARFASGGKDLLKIIAKLATNGAGVHQANYRRRTPLMEAAAHGRHDVASFLMDAGARLDSKDKDGRTALDLAREANDRGMTKILTGPQ